MTRREYLKNAGIKLNTLKFEYNGFNNRIIIDFGSTEVCKECVDQVIFTKNLKEYLDTEVNKNYLEVINIILNYKEEYKEI